MPTTDRKPRTARKVKSDTSGGMKVGSTRLRMFKALARVQYPDGLSVEDVRDKCDLPAKSGHILSLVVEEVGRGRIAKWVEHRGESAVATNVYCLTPLGLRDLKAGTVDFTRFAGKRIGTHTKSG